MNPHLDQQFVYRGQRVYVWALADEDDERQDGCWVKPVESKEEYPLAEFALFEDLQEQA